MAKKRPTGAETRLMMEQLNNEVHAAQYGQRPRRNAEPEAAGKLIVGRESVSIRFRSEQLAKVRLWIAQHRDATGRRVTLQEAVENGLQLWMEQNGIK